MEAMDRLIKAKFLVAQHIDRNSMTDLKVSMDDVNVVWFCKTLKNHKALLSSPKAPGKYYEVTYNGEAEETYLDCYVKSENICVPD